ncbi:MAG: tetratricopeptide repeat protein [Gammaproteobacteria bacterium]
MIKDSRKIAAILAADVVGYSRLMGADEEGTLAALKLRRATFDRLVAEFDGREFGSVGDSLMAQFPSALNAVRCALAIQRSIAEDNASLPTARRMELRIGVNLGDVIEEKGTLFGDGVNVAARVQSLAEPGGVLVSGAVYEQVRNKLHAQFTFVGTRQVKNIAEPVRTYAVSELAAATVRRRIGALLARRVTIAAPLYLAIAGLAVLQCERLIASASLPSWMLPALITALAAGFVPAMAITWHFDRRHRAPPWVGFAAASLAMVLACAAAWWAWRGYFEDRAQSAITRPAVKAQPVVAVAALQNLTGDPQLDWLREGVANLVRDGLAESKHLVVVSPRRWQTVLRTQAGGASLAEDVLASAARAGIDYVVSGEFLKGPEGLLLTARLSDVASGVDLVGQPNEKLTPQTLLGEATRLVLLVKRALGVPHTESVASFSADFAVNNMTAYEAYLGGLGYFLTFDYRGAERAFRTALELAPDFHMARYRLAHVQIASGDTEAALASLAAIPDEARLTPRERLYIDGARALFARDTAKAKTLYTGRLQEFPFDVEARWFLVLAHDMAFEDDAAVEELKRILAQEPENDYIWSYLGETYLRIGEYELARQALDRYMQLKPRDPFGFTILGQLDQLAGKPAEAAARFEHALELQAGFTPARLALARTEVLRDRWDDAEGRFRELVGDAAAPAAFRIDAAFDLAALLRAEGRFADSLEPLQHLEAEIRREQIREAMALAERGLAQAELGQFDEATKLIDLAVARSPGTPTRYLFARGLMLLMRGDPAGAAAVAAEIKRQQPPNADPTGAKMATENAVRAAAYLEGMVELESGRAAKAAGTLRQVDALPGYQYALYKLGLARAVLAQGNTDEALELARAAIAERDSGNVRLDDMRLDLEADRSRALLLEAEILSAIGKRNLAHDRASTFLRRWRAADSRDPERVRAEQLTTKAAGNANKA